MLPIRYCKFLQSTSSAFYFQGQSLSVTIFLSLNKHHLSSVYRCLLLIIFLLFTYTSTLLAQPLTPVLPKHGQALYMPEVEFLWNYAPNAAEYNLEIYTDEELTELEHAATTPTHNYLWEAEEYGEFFWRIQAVFENNQTSQWTPAYRFEYFVPDMIDDLELWLAADSMVTTGENNKVSEWKDLSKNEFIALQQDLDKQPLWVNNEINELPVIRFNGENWMLADFDKVFHQPNFIFMVWKNQDGNLSTRRRMFHGAGDHRILFQTHGGDVSSWGGSLIGYTPSTPFDYFLFSSLLFNQGNSKIYENGNLKTSGDVGSNAVDGITIGVDRDLISNFFRGDIAEIILFNKLLTTNQRVTIENYLRNKYFPEQEIIKPVNLGLDTIITYGFCSIELDAGEQYETYEWSTGETSQVIEVVEPGIYGVTVTDTYGFESSDSLKVTYPDIKISPCDTVICHGDIIMLEVVGDVHESYTFLWCNGSEEQFIEVGEQGEYHVEVTDSFGCSIVLSAYVNVDMFSGQITLGEDRPFCMGDELGVQFERKELKNARCGIKSESLPFDVYRSGKNDTLYLWSTGETTSTIIIHEPGIYSVTVTNPLGCSGTDTVELSFQGYTPEPSFDAPPVCFGDTTHFTDQSSVKECQIEQWFWNFGDSNQSNEQNPLHKFAQPGIFDVTLEVTSQSGCASSFKQPVQVYHLPDPDYEPLNACHVNEVLFTDLSTSIDGDPAQWQWSFKDPHGDTLYIADQQEITYEFHEPGDWRVDLVVQATTGCKDTLQRVIPVRASPFPDFEYTTACHGEPVYFTDLTEAPAWANVYQWYWDFGDGNTSSQKNPSHLFETDGEHEVTLTVTAINGCVMSVTKPVTVHSFPEVDFTAPDLCAGQSYKFTDETEVPDSEPAVWEWDFGGQGYSNEQDPMFTFHQPGQYNIKLTVTSQEGCSDHNIKVINVLPSPESSFSYDPRFGASPLTVEFINETQGATSYQWDFGDGSPQSSEKHPVHTYTDDGKYHPQLVAFDNMGCSDTTTKIISVVPVSVQIVPANISYRIIDDYLETSFEFINLSSIQLDTLYMKIRTNVAGPLRETWTGLIMPGDSQKYTFSSHIPFHDPEKHDYLCVEIVLPERITGKKYRVEDCISFKNEFGLLKPYPNPATNHIKIGFVMPYIDDVHIEIFDIYGNRVMEQKIPGSNTSKGINFIKLDLKQLSNGIYTYRVSFSDKTNSGKFLKR